MTTTESNHHVAVKFCRCCRKPIVRPIEVADGHPIHTACIPKHWQNHANGINASRCHEFGRKSKSMPCGGHTWAGAMR